MPNYPAHDRTALSEQPRPLDRLGRAIGSLVATPPVHFIALLGLCAAYIQGGLDKLLDFNAAIAEAQHFGLPFATAAACATIVTELAGSALILTGVYRWLGALSLAGFTLVATFVANRFWEMQFRNASWSRTRSSSTSGSSAVFFSSPGSTCANAAAPRSETPVPSPNAIGDVGTLPQDARHGPLPLVLIGLTVVSGLVDAVSYLGLGHVFVANMTGNVVFLGLVAGGATDISAALSLVALAFFALGALAGGRLGWNTSGHRGQLLAVSSCIQAAVVGGALLVSLALFGVRDGIAAHALVLLLAFAMGLQTATARRLGVPDLTTTVLTLTVTGLAADSHPAGGVHPNTGRRLLAIAAMFVGAFVGAALTFRVSVSAALTVAVVLLVLNTIAGYRWWSSTAAWTAAK